MICYSVIETDGQRRHRTAKIFLALSRWPVGSLRKQSTSSTVEQRKMWHLVKILYFFRDSLKGFCETLIIQGKNNLK